ncbi:hypothetical protein [Alicyclobacillus mengziensis]|uniref:Uncharacterized protein n=1 Tax=Alicyclobacillus mengziensis TaxID=2931921 RepID=A0A9X7VVR3_9BACL|nr:hypothetical protein [Alicyclobacillus mengziensis]QSO45479.1 hypothetical protein JZ786_12935 [Alicyclobacillus mengziensis]
MQNVVINIPEVVSRISGSLVLHIDGDNVVALQRGQASRLAVGSTVVILDEYEDEGMAYCNVCRVTDDGTLQSISDELSCSLSARRDRYEAI